MSKYYKVLNGSKACSGGSFKYSLPALVNGKWQAGEWHKHTGELSLCYSGFHVTQKPYDWVSDKGYDVYECAISDNCTWYDKESEKLACSKIRLLRKLSEAELFKHNIIVSGEHTITNGKYKVFGNSTVYAYNNSTVRAYDNSVVTAYNNSTVTACGNSVVTAYGNSIITACGNSVVTAYDNSIVTAWGNSIITAHDNSTVTAWDNSTVNIYSITVKATVNDQAVGINRVTGKVFNKNGKNISL
jgi:hypothetical protein